MRRTNYRWLSVLLLTSLCLGADAPAPKKKKRTLQDLLNAGAGPSGRTTSVAGVRGLDETTGEIDTKARDFAAIDRLDLVVIHEDDLQKFLNEGKLK